MVKLLKLYSWVYTQETNINKIKKVNKYTKGKLVCFDNEGTLTFFAIGTNGSIQLYPKTGDHLIAMDELINNKII